MAFKLPSKWLGEPGTITWGWWWAVCTSKSLQGIIALQWAAAKGADLKYKSGKDFKENIIISGSAIWRSWNKSSLPEKLELPAYPFKHFHVQIKHRWPITFMTSLSITLDGACINYWNIFIVYKFLVVTLPQIISTFWLEAGINNFIYEN